MPAKTVYQTDEAGVLLGLTTADESPLEPGVYLLPKGTVEEPPPEIGEHETAVWKEGGWIVTPDYRGEKVYDPETGEAMIIEELGVIPDATSPPPAELVKPLWNGSAWVDNATTEEQAEAARSQALADLAATDGGMSRVLEDLVNVLVAKGVITEADLPEEARTRIEARKTLRSML